MNSKWLHAHCTKQPSPYLKRIEAHLFERKLSLTDTSFQVLMNFFIEVSCFPRGRLAGQDQERSQPASLPV